MLVNEMVAGEGRTRALQVAGVQQGSSAGRKSSTARSSGAVAGGLASRMGQAVVGKGLAGTAGRHRDGGVAVAALRVSCGLVAIHEEEGRCAGYFKKSDHAALTY